MSSDLLWLLTRQNSSFLVKRKTNGGAQFSRDPMNMTKINSFKYSGVNKKVYSSPFVNNRLFLPMEML